MAAVPLRAESQKQDLLFEKLEALVAQEDRDLDGVLGVAIVDLTSGQALLHNATRSSRSPARSRWRFWPSSTARRSRPGAEQRARPPSFLEALYRGRVLDKAMTEDFFKVLSVPKDKYIPRGLPPGTVAANKPGWLDGVRTDSGIVFAKDRPFIVSVMTTYAQDEKAAEGTISRIAAAAYRYFDRLGRASPYGRVISPR